jgi:hypothetical protein
MGVLLLLSTTSSTLWGYCQDKDTPHTSWIPPTTALIHQHPGSTRSQQVQQYTLLPQYLPHLPAPLLLVWIPRKPSLQC